jgi:glycosyltransferase involved in cell wall biosynthesis
MMDYADLTICIPVYNEVQTIGEVLRAMQQGFPEAQIIVVDDGSTDGTAQAASAAPGARVICHGKNQGYGRALKTAMRNATGRVIAWCDGDGQHQPEDVARVVQPVLSGQKDAVIGVRGAGSTVELKRAPGKWVLKMIAQVVARDRVPDLNSGLRCFRREVILRYLHLLPDGFSASSTSTVIMMRRGYLLGYAPITAPRRVGTSTVKMLRDGWRTIHLLMRLLVLFDAFSFFSLLAAGQILFALVYGFTVAAIRGLGFPVLGAVVFISGLMTFFMGLVCDQIVALRIERFESTLPPGPRRGN